MESCYDNSVLPQVETNALHMICTINQEGKFTHVSDACKPILGYEQEELTGRFFLDFVHAQDHARTLKIIRGVMKENKTANFENSNICKSGEAISIMWSAVWCETNKLMICVGQDANNHKLAQQELLEKDELHAALIEHGSDLLSLLDAEGNFMYSSSSVLRGLGYSAKELKGANTFEFIHPEDVLPTRIAWATLLHSEKIITTEYRFKNAAGEWRWLEAIGGNQLHNPAINALVISARDITEEKESAFKLAQSEQQFRSLFENNPDMVLFQTKEGIIRDVNPAFLSFLSRTKPEVLGRSITNFLPPEVRVLCKRKLKEALAGEIVTFDFEATFERLGVKVLNVSVIPLLVNAGISGFHLVVKDITEIARAQSIIQQQAKRLNTIFDSITDAFFSVDRSWHVTCANKAFEKLTGYTQQTLVGKEIWAFYPVVDHAVYYENFHLALKTGETVHFEVYFGDIAKWYAIKAFPSDEGLFIYLSDITEATTFQEELKKLSLVASKTDNGVVILDAKGRTEWVNEGFTRLTAYSFVEAAGKKIEDLLQGPKTDVVTLQSMGGKMKQTLPFSEELIFYKKSGEKIWLALDITPVIDELGKVSRFIIILADISFRKEAETNQSQMTQDLYKQNRDLQQFTYMVSHNLRAPVANALGLLDLLNREDKSSDAFNNSLAYLKTTVVQIDTVLQDVSTILSIRDKKDVFDKEQVAVGEVCTQAIQDLQELLQQCGGKVNLDIMRGPFVNANRAYLYSIFYNLLSNSIKYRSKERPLLVEIKCTGTPGRGTLISFADNGSGFDLKKAGNNVFKLYKRFHTTKEGRGVGLYLVKTHVETMGGQIEVKSTVNVGTRFLIYLK